jgi:hypothetical protein
VTIEMKNNGNSFLSKFHNRNDHERVDVWSFDSCPFDVWITTICWTLHLQYEIWRKWIVTCCSWVKKSSNGDDEDDWVVSFASAWAVV